MQPGPQLAGPFRECEVAVNGVLQPQSRLQVELAKVQDHPQVLPPVSRNVDLSRQVGHGLPRDVLDLVAVQPGALRSMTKMLKLAAFVSDVPASLTVEDLKGARSQLTSTLEA